MTEKYALPQVINMFDKSKREQLIREIVLLYHVECPCLISFYGAFYREGAITIALEYMDGGSLANVLDQVGPIPERILACKFFNEKYDSCLRIVSVPA